MHSVSALPLFAVVALFAAHSEAAVDCSNVLSLNEPSSTDKSITYLLRDIRLAQRSNKWPKESIDAFRKHYTRIRHLSFDSSLSPTQKFQSIKALLTGFADKNSDLYKLVHKTVLFSWDFDNTIDDFCACTL